jgi:hypothetical protein
MMVLLDEHAHHGPLDPCFAHELLDCAFAPREPMFSTFFRQDRESAEIAEAIIVDDLRRTCASGMARLGVAPHVVEAVLNHRNGIIRGVAAVYNRYDFAGEKRHALELWGAHIERLASVDVVDNAMASEDRLAEHV